MCFYTTEDKSAKKLSTELIPPVFNKFSTWLPITAPSDKSLSASTCSFEDMPNPAKTGTLRTLFSLWANFMPVSEISVPAPVMPTLSVVYTNPLAIFDIASNRSSEISGETTCIG